MLVEKVKKEYERAAVDGMTYPYVKISNVSLKQIKGETQTPRHNVSLHQQDMDWYFEIKWTAFDWKVASGREIDEERVDRLEIETTVEDEHLVEFPTPECPDCGSESMESDSGLYCPICEQI